jgi:hypothetical protein
VGRQVLETTGGDLTVGEASIAGVSAVEVTGRDQRRRSYAEVDTAAGDHLAQLARFVPRGGDGQQHIGVERRRADPRRLSRPGSAP